MEKCIDLAANYLVKMKEDTNTELKTVNSWFFHVMEKCIDLAASYLVKMKEDTNRPKSSQSLFFPCNRKVYHFSRKLSRENGKALILRRN